MDISALAWEIYIMEWESLTCLNSTRLGNFPTAWEISRNDNVLKGVTILCGLSTQIVQTLTPPRQNSALVYLTVNTNPNRIPDRLGSFLDFFWE